MNACELELTIFLSHIVSDVLKLFGMMSTYSEMNKDVCLFKIWPNYVG